MKDMSWIEMMKKAQEIRLFTSLQIKRAQKGGITSAQELDFLSRIVLSDAELTPLELTVLTDLSKSAVSRLIEHLERKELLQKILWIRRPVLIPKRAASCCWPTTRNIFLYTANGEQKSHAADIFMEVL